MLDVKSLDCSRIAQDLQIRKVQVESVVQLLDEGNTVPFITRYRKERTGGLNEDVIRQIQTRVQLQRQLAERKQTILKSIDNQGKLTPELRKSIEDADNSRRLEDLYLPFKPKKRTLATAAREKGLEPLALAIWNRDPAVKNLDELLPSVVDPEKGLASVEEVMTGVQHILAEMISEAADVRAAVRFIMWDTGTLSSQKSEKLPANKGAIYKDYFEFKEPVRRIPPHRILAINRGEREGALKVKMEWNEDRLKERALFALADFCRKQAESGYLPQPTVQPEPAVSSPAPTPEEQTTEPETANVPEGTDPVATAENTAAAEGGTSENVETVVQESAPAETTETSETETSDNASIEAGANQESTPAEPAPSQEVSSPSTDAGPPALGFTIVNEGDALHGEIDYKTPNVAVLQNALHDALDRLLQPSIEREIRRELMDEAELHAVTVFARNLKALLLQRPVENCRVLAIDPAFRTGCKIAALDEYGNVLDHGVIYPHPTKKSRKKNKKAKDSATEPTPASAAESTPTPQPENAPSATDVATPTDSESSVSSEVANQEPTTAESSPAETMPSAESVTADTSVNSEGSGETSTTETAVSETEATSSQDTDGSESSTAESAEETGGEEATEEETSDPRQEAKQLLLELTQKHNLSVIAIGNGTACRETEEFVAELLADALPSASYVIVNEAGASVYSASSIGREEFPDYDATLRGTVSIGRRLQDPLAELVKIDPQHIGVGLYQHDVSTKQLRHSLEGVVESCVNQVGVDLNTASIPLLRHVAGLNQLAAREIVDYRKQHGPFRNRQTLMQVPSIGENRFVQAAGFLKISEAENPLDKTWIHPESYDLAGKLLAELGFEPNSINDASRKAELESKLQGVSVPELAKKLEAGEPTVRDIIEALQKPGRDPREDLPLPIFRKGILKLEDLQSGMELQGTVLNVVDFGVFVDIGLKDSGLVHISQMANRFVKNPYDLVAVGDVVTVWVLKVDQERNHVSLTMIKPGTERKPEERQSQEGGRRDRPPRGQRREGGDQQRRQGDQGPRRGGQQGGRQKFSGDRGRRPQQGEGGGDRPMPPRQLPPRKPKREPVKPKLSKAALEGKEPLRTFGELSALVAAKKTKDDKPKKPVSAEEKTQAQAPVEETSPTPPPTETQNPDEQASSNETNSGTPIEETANQDS